MFETKKLQVIKIQTYNMPYILITLNMINKRLIY